MPEMEEVLLADKLCSGDRPSAYVAGMVVAQSLRKTKMAVLMVNALGHVIVMPPEAVKILHPALVKDSHLDELDEGDAIRVMTSEGREDRDIVEYLKKRTENGTNGH